jgi:hypothetical protein
VILSDKKCLKMRENVKVASMVRLGKKNEVSCSNYLIYTNHTESSAANEELLSRDLDSLIQVSRPFFLFSANTAYN